MRRILVAIVLGCAIVFPATAMAGIGWELKAADEVSRVMNKRYPSYDFSASCRSVAKTRFTCQYTGINSSTTCFINGRASVVKLNRYRYRAHILSSNKSCI